MKYFAYGMNTNVKSMRSRCPRARSLGKAVLQNYRFEFKGCATVTPDFDEQVAGVLWEISDSCEQSLDMLEGYPHFYFKANVMVVKDGLYVPTMTYVMNPNHQLAYPSKHYLNELDIGYAEHGLDPAQLDRALLQIDMLAEPDGLEDLTNWQKEYKIYSS